MHFLAGMLYYSPILYFKNLGFILMGQSIYSRWKILDFFGWLFFGSFVLMYYNFKDMLILLRVMSRNFSIFSPQEKIYTKVSEINIIYLKRYESIRSVISQMIFENPERKNIPYMELLSNLLNGGNFAGIRMENILNKGKKEKKVPKKRLRDLIKKHFKKGGG